MSEGLVIAKFMETITVRELLRYAGGELICGSVDASVRSISTDSRAIGEGDLFIALKGDNFDGHDFIGAALQKGGAGFVAQRGSPLPEDVAGNIQGIIVNDTRRALGEIARGYRSRFDLTVIGVTGSNGKTTTKDMIARVASVRHETLKSRGTFNNEIGVPLTLLGLGAHHEVAVVEMGASRRGDIAYLAGIAGPSIGVITNIGPAHYEFFTSIEAVAATKGELLKGLTGESIAVLNGDDESLVLAGRRHQGRAVLFGFGQHCDVRAVDVTMEPDGRPRFRIEMENRAASHPVVLGTPGYHNIFNALAAACAGISLRLDPDEIADALDGFEGPPMRMERSFVGGVGIVNDAYNANPASVEAAIRAFAAMSVPGKKYVLMGEMLELGELSGPAHREAGRLAAELGLDGLVGVGTLMAEAVETCVAAGSVASHLASSREEAVDILAGSLKEGDALLIKGSRRNKLEECLVLLKDRLEED